MARIRHLEATVARVEHLAAVWADAPDPLARAMAADLTSALCGPAPDADKTPAEPARAAGPTPFECTRMNPCNACAVCWR